ncbi:hypothetical protein D9757_009582 [Collybiopsis confluens]|uniref:DUF6534 domain-containing protein n=1 Tax=Collybiopsis confluens TaxID=2823264 RepID=A0A8H5D6R7_9AGAR|nr:hypothetical protein D9757_012336 [Collybiopsis confluens]KAF5359955.1 hypothetical protein D9757_012240 [Collybiopsis confluens]KAF5376587.1 hypothetical protein D9757_009582 [Collybiopsis confluens]
MVWVGKGYVTQIKRRKWAVLTSSFRIHAPSAITLTDPFFKRLSVTYLTTAAVVDLVLALGMTYMLTKRSTNFDGSTRSLRLLAVLSINSGLWTAVFAILSIVLFLAFPSNVLYAIFDFGISPLYCNTLLANLNARNFVASGLKKVVTSSGGNSYNLSNIGTRPTGTGATLATSDPVKWSVAVPEEEMVVEAV